MFAVDTVSSLYLPSSNLSSVDTLEIVFQILSDHLHLFFGARPLAVLAIFTSSLPIWLFFLSSLSLVLEFPFVSCHSSVWFFRLSFAMFPLVGSLFPVLCVSRPLDASGKSTVVIIGSPNS